MRPALGAAIVLWTLIAWGGRIGLLTEGEADTATWVRIVGSIVIGVVTGVSLMLSSLEPFSRAAVWVFAAWTIVLWSRSLYVNWTGSGSLPFKLVHTALAIGFAVLAWLAVTGAATTGGDPIASPDEGHSQ